MKQVPRALAHLTPALEQLRRADRLRSRSEPVGGISFCSNDYLGLAHTPAPYGSSGGAGASRLIAGERYEHGRLEQRLSEWLGTEQTLLFSSGYAANVGVIQALVQRDDLVVSDALNHASVIDGLRMARPQVAVVPHLDVASVEAALDRPTSGRRWVITESYFSMDADSPDLHTLRRVCDARGAGLIVDEAHALGVLGPGGLGLCAEAGVEADVLIGTLGKAFGAAGAFVSGCRPLVDWLWNRARSHVFSTGMSPVVAAAAYANLERALSDSTLRERALRNASTFREALRDANLDVRGHGPIVPWILGTEADALRAGTKLRERGVHAVAIRPPTVPEGTSRIRFAFTAGHTNEDVGRAVDAVRDSFT